MEFWQDQGIVLQMRAHGEAGAVVTLLTRHHGRHAGYVPGGQSKSKRALLELGNLLDVKWQARTDDSLGRYELEQERCDAAALMGDRLRFSALRSACALCASSLAEREPHPGLFEGLLVLLETLSGPAWAESYIMWEIGLLHELGFSLNLQNCAAGGSGDLIYVSPKSGHAVSAEAGHPYKHKLLALPPFLRDGGGGSDEDSIRDGLALTGYFLENWAFAHHSHGLPSERRDLVHRIAS